MTLGAGRGSSRADGWFEVVAEKKREERVRGT